MVAEGNPVIVAALLLGCALASPGIDITYLPGKGLSLSDDGTLITQSSPEGGALELLTPAGRSAIDYPDSQFSGAGFALGGAHVAGLELSEQWQRVTPWLYQRTITLAATADVRYYLDMGWHAVAAGSFHTFEAEETASKRYSLGFAGAGFEDQSLQTFPPADFPG